MKPREGWENTLRRQFLPLLAGLVSTLLVALPAAAFDLQGHRGARGLAPENTLAAFRAALAVGVTTLELDVGVSRDGVLMIAHDPRLNPNFTRDARGQWLDAAAPGPALNTLTLAELQVFDIGRLKPGTRYAQTYAEQQPSDGERMVSLDTLFAEVKRWGSSGVRFNVETKLTPSEPALTPEPAVFARLVVDAVRRAGLESRVTVQSFDWRTLLAVRQFAPRIQTVALTVQSPNFDNLADGRWTAGLALASFGGSVPRLVQASGASTWSPSFASLNQATLKEAQALGLKVVPWTVNEPEVIERLIGWGVDGLISDYPDRVRAALVQRGIPVPAPLPAR